MKENETMVEETTVPAAEEQQEEEVVITSQQDFNAALKARLEKERQKQAKIYAEKYSGYFSPDDMKTKTEEYEAQITELGNSLTAAKDKATADAERIADLETRVQTYESLSVKQRIAHEVGLPYELANKLSGVTEEEIRQDAKTMAQFIAPKTNVALPLRNPEAAPEVDGVTKAFMALNPNMKF